MKTLKIILPILAILAILIFAGRTFLINMLSKEAKIEYQSKNNEAIIDNIDKQLKDIDINSIIAKKSLILEKNLMQLQASVKSGELTYEEITAFYLYRIKTFDQGAQGLNSVISVNPKAIEEARMCDEKASEKSSENDSYLYGIAVAIKDNINTNDMPTTAGSPALASFIPETDAEIVKKLKAEGAIIIAKTNLSEFANFKSFKMPSGYNDLKGQNMNPYGPLDITTWGSSSGSATCATSNFAAITIGTETTGSIVAPASIQGVVGFRPSLGRVSGEGIIPLSHSLDTAGPITRSVIDAAILYKNMSEDENVNIDELKDTYIEEKTIGIFEEDKNSPHTKVLIEALEKSGASIVYISANESKLNNFDVLVAEFRDDLNAYLEKYGAPFKSLKDIIAFYEEDKPNRAKYGYDLLSTAEKSNEMTDEEIKNQMELAENMLKSIFESQNVDAIAFVDNNHALLSCMAGAPEISVPLYVDANNQPHGATFSTLANNDFEALKIAYSFESKNNGRQAPIIEK